jgi:hypothetical protein
LTPPTPLPESLFGEIKSASPKVIFFFLADAISPANVLLFLFLDEELDLGEKARFWASCSLPSLEPPHPLLILNPFFLVFEVAVVLLLLLLWFPYYLKIVFIRAAYGAIYGLSVQSSQLLISGSVLFLAVSRVMEMHLGVFTLFQFERNAFWKKCSLEESRGFTFGDTIGLSLWRPCS